MRLSLPCRGLSCNHIQCFDATSYLQLQEQGPQWLCPICNKPAPFEQLAIDECAQFPQMIPPPSAARLMKCNRYARQILTQTADSVEQVTIEPSGEWAVPGARKQSSTTTTATTTTPNKHQDASYIDDDDVVAISDIGGRGAGGRSLPSSASVVSLPTPHLATPTSRDTSAAPRSSVSNKRPAPEVIDLTLSDDDEEDAPPPVKRAKYAGGYGSTVLF